MEIKIQIRGEVYSIHIGRKAKWYNHPWFICILREKYEDYQFVWTDILWHS